MQRCNYEILGVDRQASDDVIKKAYRKLALKNHPDKAQLNNLTKEDATEKFQEINDAYVCLSDPQERAYYDLHRERILYGFSNDDNDPDAEKIDPFVRSVNLTSYRSFRAYKSFSDADEKSFFKVYAEIFSKIDKAEREWDDDGFVAPVFGGEHSEWKDGPGPFYRYWMTFRTRRPCAHADKYDPHDPSVPNRQTKRYIESENKVARKKAKTEYSDLIIDLVRYVQNRDPRVDAQHKKEATEQLKKAEEKAAKKEKEKEERRIAREAARIEEEERWAEAERIQMEQEGFIKEGVMNGTIPNTCVPAMSSSASSSLSSINTANKIIEEEPEEITVFRCDLCRKTFKSERVYDNHCQSKKHKQLLEKFMAEVESASSADNSPVSKPVSTPEKSFSPQSRSKKNEKNGDQKDTTFTKGKSRKKGKNNKQVSDSSDDEDNSPLSVVKEEPEIMSSDIDSAELDALSSSDDDEKNKIPRKLSRTKSGNSKKSAKTNSDSDDSSSDDDFLAQFARLNTAKKQQRKVSSVKSESASEQSKSETSSPKNGPASSSPKIEITPAPKNSSTFSVPQIEKAHEIVEKAKDITDKANEITEKAAKSAEEDENDKNDDNSDIDIEDAVFTIDALGKTKKKKRRKAKELRTPHFGNKQQTPTPASTNDADPSFLEKEALRCTFCGTLFKTKNKLFDHLKNNPSHMQLKPSQKPGKKR